MITVALCCAKRKAGYEATVSMNFFLTYIRIKAGIYDRVKRSCLVNYILYMKLELIIMKAPKVLNPRRNNRMVYSIKYPYTTADDKL